MDLPRRCSRNFVFVPQWRCKVTRKLIMSLPILSEQYGLGFSHIKRAIEDCLDRAGARMATNSVFVPKGRYGYAGCQTITSIAAVPLDAPKFTVEFTQQEIVDCWESVSSGNVSHKIALYSKAYARFRNSPERNVRSLSRPQRSKVPAETAARKLQYRTEEDFPVGW